MMVTREELLVEYENLKIKINRINHFIYSDEFDKLPMKQKKQIMKQEIHMSCYVDILSDRLYAGY